MSISGGIVAFVIIWWVVVFAVLPFGVRTQREEGEITPGTADSAPVKPMLVRKAIATTIIASVLWGVLWAVIEYQLISLDDFPY
ncbi:MAG: DUF1467 family protein [Alphaproteobacteria bacterium]